MNLSNHKTTENLELERAFFKGLLVFATVATAQQYRTNIFGIRAGYSLSDMTGNYLEGEKISDPRSSFHVGVSDRILLSRRYPLYLETGLYLSNKGVKLDIAYEDVPGTSQIRPRVALMYLQLPVMIAYHFRLGRATALQPFVGGYHSVGISCKQKEGYSGRITGTATTDSAKRKTTRPPGFRENARRNTKNPLRIPEGIFTIARRRHRTAPAAAIYL